MKNKRINEMKAYIESKGSVSMQELLDEFPVSIQTIRRDLSLLEESNLISKTYGGAIWNESDPKPRVPSIRLRREEMQTEKKLIAKKALKHIENSSTIALDAGSTMYELARLLELKENLTVITSDALIAGELVKQGKHRIYMIGGFLSPNGVSNGAYAKEFLEQISTIDTFLFSTDGITEREGLTNDSGDTAYLKRLLLDHSMVKIALIDNLKFGKRYFYKTCTIFDIDRIITDKKPPASFIKTVKDTSTIIDY